MSSRGYQFYRCVGKPGNPRASGARDRGIEARHADQKSPRSAAGSARALGAWGREFEPLRGDQRQWCVWRSGSAPECEPGGRRFDPDHAPQLHRPIGGTGRRSGFKSRGRKACRFESCIGHQQSIPSWRNRQTHRSQKPGPTGMSVRLGPRGPTSARDSSDGLEQGPHKAWVGGSNPPRATSTRA